MIGLSGDMLFYMTKHNRKTFNKLDEKEADKSIQASELIYFHSQNMYAGVKFFFKK